jgi:hypothetical protein
MTFSFNPNAGLILVEVELAGPALTAVVRMALDTGCRRTVVHPDHLVEIGYDPSSVLPSVQATTASGIVQMSPLSIMSLDTLGQARSDFQVLSHALPPATNLDGLLGLDFFRGQVLTINFQKGEITLEPGASASPTP